MTTTDLTTRELQRATSRALVDLLNYNLPAASWFLSVHGPEDLDGQIPSQRGDAATRRAAIHAWAELLDAEPVEHAYRKTEDGGKYYVEGVYHGVPVTVWTWLASEDLAPAVQAEGETR